MIVARMKQLEFRYRPMSLIGIVVLCTFSAASGADNANAPDVLFLVVDDMNDWVSLLDTKAPIKTPNLERLAQRGMLFTRAYCAPPACNPPRAATLTGLRPSTTGVYGNKSDGRAAMPHRHRGHGATMGYAVRTYRYRYVEWQDWDSKQVVARELYDHHHDPHESRNLAAQPKKAAAIQELAEMLEGGWRSVLPVNAEDAP